MSIDYFVEAKRPMAYQVVRRRRSVLAYMEQWGFRWQDLRRAHPAILRAMIYNPDEQEWDEISLQIGREVCDLFVPYFDRDKLHDFIEEACRGDR